MQRWYVAYDADKDQGVIRQEDGAGAPVVIQFQHGPVAENGINGIQNEEVIDLLIMRLIALDARFPCDENKAAIGALQASVNALRARTAKRVEQGVEGKNEAHVS